MSQPTLDYQRPFPLIKTLQWRRDGAAANWRLVVGDATDEKFELRHDARRNTVTARHRDDQWLLELHWFNVRVKDLESQTTVATLRRRLIGPNEIQFISGRSIAVTCGRSFRITPTEQFNFGEGGVHLLSMRKSFWSIGKAQVRVEIAEAGAELPERSILMMLGFYEIVRSELANSL